MPIYNSTNPLRGHNIEVVIPPEVDALVEKLEQIGFARNEYLIEVAKTAIQFAKDENARIEKSLVSKNLPHDPVVCRHFSGMRGRTEWMFIRKKQDEWILSALLFENS